MNNFPFISIIMPVRNEARFIAKSLGSVLSQDYPKEKMEVIIVDGMSDDGTREILYQYQKKDKRVKVFLNPYRIIPCGLNKAILMAKGEIIVRIDGHWYIPKGFLMQVCNLFQTHNIDCLGGRIIREVDTPRGAAIELARKSWLGGRLSIRNNPAVKAHISYRSNIAHIWRRYVFDKVGLFDERFIRNEDNEFNLRTLRAGLKTFYSPSIFYHQYVRKDYLSLFRQLFNYAFYIPMLVVKHRRILSFQIMLPSLGLFTWLVMLMMGISGKISLMVSLILLVIYVFVVLLSGLVVSIRAKRLNLLLSIIWAYFTIHSAVVLGYICGIGKLFNFPLFLSLWRDYRIVKKEDRD